MGGREGGKKMREKERRERKKKKRKEKGDRLPGIETFLFAVSLLGSVC